MHAANLYQTLLARLRHADRPRATRLEAYGLEAAFAHYLPTADEAVLEALLGELLAIDLDTLGQHHALREAPPLAAVTADEVEPVAVFDGVAPPPPADLALAAAALSAGAFGGLAFAGGAATRFAKEVDDFEKALPPGNEGLRRGVPPAGAPKGAYPITPVFGLSFIEVFLAEALAAAVAHGRVPPYVFMTSHLTHEATCAALDRSPLRGYPRESAVVIGQARHPRLDEVGRLIIDPTGRLIWTGDGHGGVFAALRRPGNAGEPPLVARLLEQGVRHLVLHNVDNPATTPFAPARLGYHLRSRAVVTLTLARRASPAEKVGMPVLLKRNGRVEVIEYTVLDPQLACATAVDGTPLLAWAHLNVNLVDLARLPQSPDYTLYRDKQVRAGARTVLASSAEMLNQHVTRQFPREAIGLYGVGREYFLPTKSVLGVDSVETTVRAQLDATARALVALGATVARDAAGTARVAAEIHPALGAAAAWGALGVGAGWRLGADSRLGLAVRYGVDGAAPPFAPGLVLEPGASLLVDVAQPYGAPRFSPESRAFAADPASAGRVSLGRDVRLAAGVDLRLVVEGDGRAELPAGATYEHSFDCRVAPGERVVLRPDGPVRG